MLVRDKPVLESLGNHLPLPLTTGGEKNVRRLRILPELLSEF